MLSMSLETTTAQLKLYEKYLNMQNCTLKNNNNNSSTGDRQRQRQDCSKAR
ncbi:hypothetical protein DOY81_004987 [Sarcophaga bullata]|nr:hypothetical protein DOY81_004987 [Sarcophaga bullata]